MSLSLLSQIVDKHLMFSSEVTRFLKMAGISFTISRQFSSDTIITILSKTSLRASRLVKSLNIRSITCINKGASSMIFTIIHLRNSTKKSISRTLSIPRTTSTVQLPLLKMTPSKNQVMLLIT